MEFFNNLTKIMEQKGISAYQLEKDNIVRQTTFASWKKGTQPALDKVIKLLQYIEVTPNELFGYQETFSLTENETELLNLFKQLPEREQIKFIGRLEDTVEKYKGE